MLCVAVQPSAGRELVPLSVNEQRGTNRRATISAASSRQGRAVKAKTGRIAYLDKEIDKADDVMFADPILETIRGK
jgi:hypothetical protein